MVSIELALKGTPDVMDVPSTRFEVTPLEDNGITVRGRDIIFKPGRKPTFDVLYETEAYDVRLFFFHPPLEVRGNPRNRLFLKLLLCCIINLSWSLFPIYAFSIGFNTDFHPLFSEIRQGGKHCCSTLYALPPPFSV
jgi:hypothetical protein